MISRVFINTSGYIALDSDMFGDRKRISTGKKPDKRLLTWYEKHFDSEFSKLYEWKYGVQTESSLTFREYGNMVIKLTNNERTPETIKEVKGMFERLCVFFGDMALSEIKSTDIRRWQVESGYASKTISNYRSYINIILETAYNDDIIRKNPLKLVKQPKQKTVIEKIFYSEDEILAILEHSEGSIKNILEVCSFTGIRGGELIGLKWKDVDFEKEEVVICGAIRDGRSKSTKNEKTRIIPMFKPTKEALLRQRKLTGIGEMVFLSGLGKKYYNQDTINRAMKKACVKAKVKVGTLHDLRRSFNTLLKQYGYPEDFILDIIGNIKEVNRNHYTGKLNVDLSKFDKFAV